MPVYWVASYNVKEGKGEQWIKWLSSDGAKELFKRIEAETGFKHINDYSIAYGGTQFDWEVWYELPNYAALDKIRDSKSWDEQVKTVGEMVDIVGAKLRLYRSASELRRYP